jgi:hypothetical protein
VTEPPLRGDVILVDPGEPIGHEGGLTQEQGSAILSAARES